MNADRLNDISPFVRIAKIVTSSAFSNSWIDYDNVLTYIEDGEAEFSINGITYPVSKGDLILVPPFVNHLINVTSARPLIQYIAHFDLYFRKERTFWDNVGISKDGQNEVYPEEMYFSGFSPVSRLPYVDQKNVNCSFLKMYREYMGKSPNYSLLSKALLIELIIIFLRNQKIYSLEKGIVTKGWAIIKKSIDYIHSNYCIPDLDNIKISWDCGVSSSHLSFIFKDQLGISVHKYLNQVRIEEAKKLIAIGDETLSSIAERVGFASLHQFSKVFKKQTGVAPSHFLAVYARRVEA
ncbi:hypothetical protein Back11_44020 [Paenibacillus baekrokdamisoli]|uniref:Uncharacterized protein n=1 Tax=Paenibacillus baekrokdamisoli TaxID=1712516 RepID=A0A3G9IVZ0_9BACL|nr:AraC family transcriptional regulator [Paenibacillus baekrokdamisoli]MBB3067895.1 AraC-like DNA-binding protein [Paenibacillus baekrokdamisoli]BBH23057.1 hypothetical protein Back11_44020 [Paenibacillus baekrokdamisoli]